MRPLAEPENAETQRREESNINQCINHVSPKAECLLMVSAQRYSQSLVTPVTIITVWRF